MLAVRSGFAPATVLPPLGYGATVDPEDMGDRPLGVAVVPGIQGQPVKHSDGLYEMSWDAAAGVAVSARSADEAKALAEVYAAAVRACVLQHAGLNGLASSTRWVDERIEEINWNPGVSVWAATVQFVIAVDAAVDGYATASPSPVVERYQITVQNRDFFEES